MDIIFIFVGDIPSKDDNGVCLVSRLVRVSLDTYRCVSLNDPLVWFICNAIACSSCFVDAWGVWGFTFTLETPFFYITFASAVS